ncbi:hypothetical protein BJ875DRAFT_481616 [Amylocarpus encephaloides]|uniref:Autophagy-related protein 33 n=1 Tax=Amylocarpus encephaloides TaxID=45428 RepID=A0A9P7YPN3_9HELO|nr:hypothetical protein BJ875DRAFT_481616 [Amylocarpus encephaloides]
MASKGVSTLKFVGVCSLGLLTGVSYTLSALTLPSLLTLSSASTASNAFTNLTKLSLTHLRGLAGISSGSFLLAYILSPRSQKHPYLLWTTLFVAGSGISDFLLRPAQPPSSSDASAAKQRERKSKGKRRQMDASYEVVGASDRESEVSSEEMDGEDVNGEQVRVLMEAFAMSHIVRTAISGLAFALSIVGVWGDGVNEMVVIEL